MRSVGGAKKNWQARARFGSQQTHGRPRYRTVYVAVCDTFSNRTRHVLDVCTRSTGNRLPGGRFLHGDRNPFRALRTSPCVTTRIILVSSPAPVDDIDQRTSRFARPVGSRTQCRPPMDASYSLFYCSFAAPTINLNARRKIAVWTSVKRISGRLNMIFFSIIKLTGVRSPPSCTLSSFRVTGKIIGRRFFFFFVVVTTIFRVVGRRYSLVGRRSSCNIRLRTAIFVPVSPAEGSADKLTANGINDRGSVSKRSRNARENAVGRFKQRNFHKIPKGRIRSSGGPWMVGGGRQHVDHLSLYSFSTTYWRSLCRAKRENNYRQ